MRRMPVVISIGLLLLILLEVACSDAVDPVIGSEVPYTIWGFLDSDADTQKVRVFPVLGKINFRDTAAIDARVFSVNLTVGERREWHYRGVKFDTIGIGYVFWSPLRPQHGHRFRLEVVRSDGEMSHAEVVIPRAADFDVDIDATTPRFTVTIRSEVPYLVGARAIYRAMNNPPAHAWPAEKIVHPRVALPATISYDKEKKPFTGGWSVTVLAQRDFLTVREEFQKNCLITRQSPDIWLREVEFNAVATDSTWMPPGGVFDPDALGVPGTFSNVENGYGFFGAGQVIRFRWTPPEDMILRAGFRKSLACPDGPEPRTECMNPPEPCIGENPDDIWDIWLR